MTKLNHKFFTKIMGWVELEGCWDVWRLPDGSKKPRLPNPAGCWEDFHKWVVALLMASTHYIKAKRYLKETVGNYFCTDTTPAKALEWAMEELKDAS